MHDMLPVRASDTDIHPARDVVHVVHQLGFPGINLRDGGAACAYRRYLDAIGET